MLPNSPSPTDPTVLIVDNSEDSRDVLREALQRRGVRILEASEARQGAVLARQYHPRVIILDLETDAADDDAVCDQYDAESREHDARLVILGRARRFTDNVPCDRIVPKPYHYGPLVRTIERLLDRNPAA